jgi:DNA polymerase-3 subunit alpha
MSHYDYFEVQPHINSEEQKVYNKKLLALSKALNIPLIAGTDTHSLNKYKAECRNMLKYGKDIIFDNEDEFDLTYKTYDELVEMFSLQGSLPKEECLVAIKNTNVMADSVEEFKLDLTFKYPKLSDNEEADFKHRVNQMYKDKISKGIIKKNPKYLENIQEEFRVLKKIGMLSFMQFMSELIVWCHENDIPTCPCRGSVGGSVIAYITDIIDVDPIIWNTKFSRFANEDRLEIGDIDEDFAPNDREKVYEYIINRFGIDKTAYILTTNTLADKGAIDDIVRGFANKYRRDHNLDKKAETPYSLAFAKEIKTAYENNSEEARTKYKEIFYYFDGMRGCVVSKGIHPAGIIASPITLPDNYGTFWYDGKRVITINMEEVHEVSLVKYDILGLKNIGIIKDACKLIGINYPKSHEVNWDDENVWNDMIKSSAGIFQFEGNYAFELLKKFNPHKINDMSLVNASLRPSGESYRDRLINKEINHNPSEIIDELLKDNYGYLVFQEDVTRFLQDICGLSGSEADNVRRAIGRKQLDRLQEALPNILEGYCSKSEQTRNVAEEEAKIFLKIIEDSSNYMFGFNHSTGYSMIGYLCAMLRYYYPSEFVAAYLNNADNEEDISNGSDLAKLKGININPIKFRHSKGEYFVDKETNDIYKGISSVKFLNSQIADELYNLRNNEYNTFTDLLVDINSTSVNSRQLQILIELDFFSEFGDINKLDYINDKFNKFYGKKSLRKDNIEQLELTDEIIAEYTDKVTDKTYMGIKDVLLIKYFESKAPLNTTKLKDKIDYQIKHLGCVTIRDERYKGYVIIIDLDIKYSPKLKVYALANGSTLDVKIDKKTFNRNKLNVGDIIIVNKQKTKPKMSRNSDGSFSPIEGSKEWWLEDYKRIEVIS